MRKLIVFNQVSLDGYFTDADGDMSWAHKQDAEWNAFVAENAKSGGELLFVAEQMNNLPKIVFSRTLDKASWNNTKLVGGDLAAEIRKMKNEPGEQMVIMGSGTIVSQLTAEGLIDEYQIAVNPIVLAKGRTMFQGIKRKLNLKRTKTRSFGNGNVLLCYEPIT